MATFDELPEKVKSRLAGAFKLANDSQNPGEAASASARVQEMLLKYNITLTNVAKALDAEVIKNKFAGMTSKEIVFGGVNRDRQAGMLAKALADYMFVEVIWTHVRSANNPNISFNALKFIGAETDVEIVVQLYNKLNQAINRMANKGLVMYKKMGGNAHGNGWKTDFYWGCVDGIREQLKENYELFQRSRYNRLDGEVTNSSVNSVTGREIIVDKNALLKDYLDENFGKVQKGGKIKKNNINETAYVAGYKVGRDMEINERLQ